MSTAVQVRKAVVADVDDITTLFRSTIQTINSKDYDAQQVRVWSSGADHKERWINKIAGQYFVVACCDNRVAGFASLATDGYLDYMFVHKDFQRKGIARALLLELEEYAAKMKLKTIYSNVSITAKGFFEKYGYVVKAKQENVREGVVLINYRMEKQV